MTDEDQKSAIGDMVPVLIYSQTREGKIGVPVCGHSIHFPTLESNPQCECRRDNPSHDGGREFAVPKNWRTGSYKGHVLRFVDERGEVVKLTICDGEVHALSLGRSFYLPRIVYR